MNNEKDILDTIKKSNKDIFVVGTRGIGKTITLNGVLNKENDKFIINGTLNDMEYILLRDRNISDLYYICLTIKKIIIYLKERYTEKYISEFIFFEIYIDSILKQIYFMFMTDMYKNDTNLINGDIYNTPEVLLDEFLGLLSKRLDIKDLVLVIDKFDEIGGSSQMYQEFIYNKLKSYLRLIMTISDKKVVNSDNLLNEFSKDNEIVKLDYSMDIESVKEILDKEIKRSFIRNNLGMQYNLSFVLSDETIKLMIKKTNGNLFDMLNAIRYLYYHIKELNKNEYDTYIIDYIDNVINRNPIFTGIIIPERKLYIKPRSI